MLQSLALWNPSFTSAMQTELETGNSPFTTFNFANVDSNNYPSTRTVILRGFLFDQEKTNILVFTTDKRSSKYKDLLLNPKFDACFYFHKLRKQFRFKGTVRMISDDLVPIISYNHLITDDLNNNDNKESDLNNDRSDSDNSIIDDEEQSLINQYLSLSNNEKISNIKEPLNYKLLSPKFIKSFEDSSISLSELGNRLNYNQEEISKTPTNEEWELERLRVWNSLSRNMKKSFKKPLPGSPLTEENRKLLDAINRGVDGSNSSTGYENFVVVCMFVDLVDEVVLGGSGDRRYLYRRTHNDLWKEHEVCP
ncbi:hypothetical protein C6P40_005424 [Pichia californica]|uniref:Pyridoxamine 5'-phosphate oxidase Alr4036 family FMN-binding domain-containing protein n=1 Tax=Pichia californica TaxID=460514 RepID=A0A9P7BGU8_9ASCO|nr:hypothetical protein C6P42_000592 [[Candida] californica]KAG0689194.1 hypothetical protein C6P40_005424 [[Candida] californica]